MHAIFIQCINSAYQSVYLFSNNPMCVYIDKDAVYIHPYNVVYEFAKCNLMIFMFLYHWYAMSTMTTIITVPSSVFSNLF